MDEEVSNLLQDRHKFVVDILLNIVLLEEEINSLSQRVDDLERRRKDIEQREIDKANGLTNIELASLSSYADESPSDREADVVRLRSEEELRAVQEQLLADRDEQLKVLHVEFDRKRAVAAWVSSLLNDSVSRNCGSSNENLFQFHKEELDAEEAERAAIIEEMYAANEQQAISVCNENLSASMLVLKHERDLKRLKDSLDSEHESKVRALKERLAKKRAARVAYLVENEGKSESDAILQASEEYAAEEEAEMLNINQEVSLSFSQSNETSLASIRQFADSAASRLEDSLNAQKSEQQRALIKRLEKRKQEAKRRIESEVISSGKEVLPAEKDFLLAAAYVKIENAAEEEAALIEAQNIAKVRSARAQMVALVRNEHEKECERLESELQLQKEKRVKDLKVRLERKKVERAKEIMSNTSSSTSSEMAVALAQEELAIEEKAALNKINAESDAAVEKARKDVLEKLRDMHEKESSRLEDDMKYQENIQRTNLKHRLERQRKVKEQELQAVTLAANVAQQSKTALSELQANLEREMSALAQKEELLLQESLRQLKIDHDKQTVQLSEDLIYKKSYADKRLKDRLAQRAVSNSGTVKLSSRKVDALGGTEKVARVMFTEQPTIHEAHDTETCAENLPPDTSVSVDEFIGTLKLNQANLLSQLTKFIQFEKLGVIAEIQVKVKSATTKQASESALNELAKSAMLYDHLMEFLVTGLKKTFLYEIKAVKEYVSRPRSAKAPQQEMHHDRVSVSKNTSVGPGIMKARLSKEDVEELKGLTIYQLSRAQASEKVVDRFQRDISAMLDSQVLERRTTVAQMRANGSAASHVQRTRHEMLDHHLDIILAELEKSFILLFGVWLDRVLLEDIVCMNAKNEVNNSQNTMLHPAWDEEEEEDEAMMSSKSVHDKAAYNEKKLKLFGPRLVSWFSNILSTLELIKSAPCAMQFHFEQKFSEVP
jgi:hypothetical protein